MQQTPSTALADDINDNHNIDTPLST